MVGKCTNWKVNANIFLLPGKEFKKEDDNNAIAITFLLTVNDTWYPNEYPGKTCLHTVKTPPIKPGIPWNESVDIVVGECDHGPLTYTISKQLDGMQVLPIQNIFTKPCRCWRAHLCWGYIFLIGDRGCIPSQLSYLVGLQVYRTNVVILQASLFARML